MTDIRGEASGGMRWRLLRPGPSLSGAENMALDHALLERARTSGETVVRVYTWARPTLSLGRNQPARDRYDLERVDALAIDVVRRPTGGRALLHHRELTYSVSGPVTGGSSLRADYARINRLLVHALAQLGVDTSVASDAAPAAPPSVAPCFEEPAAGELTWRGRKLVGSAQWRDGDAYLQHGSILVDDDQALVSTLLREPMSPPPPAATLREALGRAPGADELATALLEVIRRNEDASAALLVPDDSLRDMTTRTRSHYEDDAWTWRR